MFAITFQTALVAILQIFLMASIGFLLAKQGVLTNEALKLLSALTVNVFFPCFSFYQLTHHFDFKAIPFWWIFPCISLTITATAMTVSSLILCWRKDFTYKNEFRAVVSIHNAGYLPLLLVTTLPLGAQADILYIYILLALIGFDLSLWSLGVWLLNRTSGFKMQWQQLINPPLMTLISALVMVALGWHQWIPEPVVKPVKLLGDCAMPMAMIVIGGNLALTSFVKVKATNVAMACVAKLLILPTLALIAVLTIPMDPLISLLIMIQSAVPTGMTLSIIGRHHNTRGQDFVNQTIFFTHLLSLITLPVFLTIYSYLMR